MRTLKHHKNFVPFHSLPSASDGPGHLAFSEDTSSAFQALPFILEFTRRNWHIIAASIAATLCIACIYLFITPARYTATSTLMLDARRMQIFQQNVMSELSFDASAVDSQLEVLKSEAVALFVIEALGLRNDPEFTAETTSIVKSITAPVINMISASDEKTGKPNRNDPLLQRALDRFRSSLTVQRVDRSYVVNIGFQSLDGDKAARIANAVGEAYIQDQLQSKHTATKRATVWLKERIDELRQEAETADRAALAFRSKNSLTSTDGKLLSEQQLSEISTQLGVAKAQTAEAKARLDRILDISRRGIDDAAVGDSLQNTVLNRLQQQYVEAAKRQAEFASRYGSDHLAAANLRKEMQQIQDVSKAEMNRIAESYKSDYEIARKREESLQQGLNDLVRTDVVTREAQIGLRQLESSANAYRTLHDSFLQRFVEATQLQSVPNTEARIITAASGAEKTHPMTLLVLAVSGFLGAGLGCAIAFFGEGLDHVFRTARHVEQVLGVRCLGIVPTITNVSPQPQADASLNKPEARMVPVNLGLARQVVAAPFSRFAETIRSVKVAIDTSPAPRGAKVIGLTSALPEEGKSTIASNLSQLMAHSGKRALLVDADLRNPSLTRRIAPHATSGILEVLSGTTQLSETIWHDPVTGLDFIPAVMETPVLHTSDVLASERMTNFLAIARNYYDYIVIDLPPIAPVVDTKAAAHQVDAFVFVIEWGQTSPQMIVEALGGAEAVESKLLGVVLNKANSSKLKKIETSKAGNYYKYYQSDDG
jgi:succinoglycan biosynthesis transport protein ExoP